MPAESTCTIDGCSNSLYIKARGMCVKHYSRWYKTGTTDLPPRLSDEERFFTHVLKDEETGCWLWQGPPDTGGYGAFGANKVQNRAHRWSYEHFVGPIPDGYQIDHLCRVRPCVNPAHLEPVTRSENIIRMYAVKLANVTHCNKGHEYPPESAWIPGKGRKPCQECRRIYNAAHRTPEWRRQRKAEKASGRSA